MTSFNSGAQPQNRAPQSIGFLLLDNFTLISLASACLLYTSPSPRDKRQSRMPSSA